MAGSSKAPPAVPNDVKNYIRSVLLSNPKGIKVDALLRDYKELVGTRLEYRKYGATSLEGFLKLIPDVARLAQVKGIKKVYGIPDSASYQNMSMKLATKALQRLPQISKGEGDQSTKPPSKYNGKQSKKYSRNGGNGMAKSKLDVVKTLDSLFTDLRIRDDPLVQKWWKELQVDSRGRYSITVRDRPGITQDSLREDFSKYGEVIEVHSITGLHFIRFKNKTEVIEAMFNLRNQYEIGIAKTNRAKRQVLMRRDDQENLVEDHEAANRFDENGDADLIVDVCVENLPPNISRADIDELLYLGYIPSSIVMSQEVFSKTDNSFAYLRVKGTADAQKLTTALQKLTWREHKVTAKMPQHALPVTRASPGQKRKVTDRSSYSALLKSQLTVVKQKEDDRASEDESDDDDLQRMPELEMSTFEDDDALVKRNYFIKKERDGEEEFDDEDDEVEMPELEPLPILEPVAQPEQTHSPESEPKPGTKESNESDNPGQIKYMGTGAGKPVLTVKNFPPSTTKDELGVLFDPYNPRCVFRITDNYNQLAGKITFWNMESLFQAYTDLNGTMFKGKKLTLYRSDTQASKSGHRIKEARSLFCTVANGTADDSEYRNEGAIDPTYRSDFKKLTGQIGGQVNRMTSPAHLLQQARPGLLPHPVFPLPYSHGRVVTRITGAAQSHQHDGTFFMLRDINLVVQQMMNSCFPGIPFWSANDIPENFEVLVTCVMNFWNPTIFWGQLISKDAKEDVRMLMKLQENFPRNIESYQGMPYCVAPVMGEWRRACVLSNLPHGKVKVFFIDYGNIAVLNVSEIRSLPDQFWNLPPQALPFFAVSNYVGNVVNEDILVACKKPRTVNLEANDVVVPASILLKKK